MKYRRNKVKREHSIIEGALEWLEDLSSHPEVTDIIPGVIDVTHSPERGIFYKYETATGCKLLLKNGGSIQEAFVVTKNPDLIKEWINRFTEDLTSQEKQKNQIIGERKKKKEPQKVNSQVKRPGRGTNNNSGGLLTGKKEKALRRRSQDLLGIKEDFRLVEINQKLRDSYVESLASMADLEEPRLGEKISPAARDALKNLKKSLEEKKKP